MADEEKEKGFIQRLAERFFPPAALGAELKKKTAPRRPATPPTGRRRPPAGAPIDKMGEERKKAKGSEGYYDAAGTR